LKGLQCLGATSCSVAQHPDASDVQADRIQLYFQCNSGTIADPSNIIFGMVDRGSTCTYVDEVNFDNDILDVNISIEGFEHSM